MSATKVSAVVAAASFIAFGGAPPVHADPLGPDQQWGINVKGLPQAGAASAGRIKAAGLTNKIRIIHLTASLLPRQLPDLLHQNPI